MATTTINSTTFTFSIAPDPATTGTAASRKVPVDVTYSQVVKITPASPDPSNTKADTTPAPPAQSQVITDVLRFELDNSLRGSVTLVDVLNPSDVKVEILADDGRPIISKTRHHPTDFPSTILLDANDIEAITATPSQPSKTPPGVSRDAVLVDLLNASGTLDFPRMLLQVAPFEYDAASWNKYVLEEFFHSEYGTVAIMPSRPLPPELAGLAWRVTRVAVDGTFKLSVTAKEAESARGWAWLLSGPNRHLMVGVVIEKLEPLLPPRSILLPAPPPTDGPTKPTDKDCHCEKGTVAPPPVTSEAEIANNPQIYTEDPGSFCKPFSNPERVLSERSFYTVLRLEAPVISAVASKYLEEPVALDFDPPDEMFENINAESINFAQLLRSSASLRSVVGNESINSRFAIPELDQNKFLKGSVLRTNIAKGLQFIPGTLPTQLNNYLEAMNRGRTELNAQHPAQWDNHSLRYQATTVAVGHILEFRARTRSNGYSLGGVAKTLTLAPRQTKRVQKIEWSRSERGRRIETTEAGDETSDSMTHDTSYQDAVAATLGEWSKGSSKSSVTGAAGGVGAVLGPVVIGGGVAHSSASSSSQQQGGRSTTANEESQWRDAIRRHGDSLRKFESMVVQEVTQNEQVTGTVEVIRNVNYAHSLTVIYHNILRHLRVETDFAGVRECLFVPFAMKPFTLEKIYRWRETLKDVLRERKYAKALVNMKDILTGFKYSKIPPGRRADHQIRSLYGSIYIDIGVARPLDTADGKFNQDVWGVLAPYLPLSALAVWQQFAQQVEANRDALYQRNFAPSIATKWCNVLEIRSSDGTVINADFTLASPYSFNRSVRVDFQVNSSQMLTRANLTSLTISARSGLSVGSIANLRSLTYTYQTDYESGSISLKQGKGDLIDTATGRPDLNGAHLASPLTLYEQQNPRADLVFAVTEMLEHFNEHIEYYHKMIWWRMDRDKLFMLLDGFVVPKSNPVTSIASIIERDPIAVAGNSLVFRVSPGSYLGSAQAKTPEELFNWYHNHQAIREPMNISLPTDGLYAQTIMDECVALEEHYGSLDWVLNDPDPELGSLDPSLLMSRRTEATNLEPTKLPETIINLSNGTSAPAPQGLAAVLAAVQNANAFRDMAGLEGTQGLAKAGLEAAASLATSFGGSATSLKLAEMTAQKQAVQDVDKKLASLERAMKKGLASASSIQDHTDKIFNGLTSTPDAPPPHQDRAVQDLIQAASSTPNSTMSAETKEGVVRVAFGLTPPAGATATTAKSVYDNPVYQAAVKAAKNLPKPTWSQWMSAYPSYVSHPSSPAVRVLVGGQIENDKDGDGQTAYVNTCAIRFSRGWNYAVSPLPKVPVTKGTKPLRTPLYTRSGGDGKNYALRVAEMREWLIRVWGAAPIVKRKRGWDGKVGGFAGEPFDKTILAGQKGIVAFSIEHWADARGHIDAWDGNGYSSELNPDEPHPGYWEKAWRVEFWPLSDEMEIEEINGEGLEEGTEDTSPGTPLSGVIEV